MDYLTTTEAAERWGITPRRVQVLYKSGRIEGAVYKGIWLIPANAEKPEDPRKIKRREKQASPLPAFQYPLALRSSEPRSRTCPNCHKRMHILDKTEDIEKLQEIIK